MSDTFPNGVEKFGVTCPGCGTAAFLQMPAPEHKGKIRAECGACTAYFEFDSPHGPAEAVAVHSDVVVSDNGVAHSN